MNKRLLKGILMLVAVTLSFSVSAQVIYVNTNAAAGGDGTSWGTAYRDLQTALIDATNGTGDELWVAQGSYFIIGTTDTYFEIPNDVEVYGGFLGTENTRNDRDWENNVTILDGVNAFHTIVFFLNTNSNTILDGFTIQQGFADGTNTKGRSGAAIFIDVTSGNTSDPKILNCTLKNNYADGQGGAVYIDGGISGSCAPLFENCLFENNEAFSSGGAIYGSGIQGGSCNPTFNKCTFRLNESSASGGAIFFNGGDGNTDAIIKKCNFESNTADDPGGAIYTTASGTGQGNHTIINSRFYNNTALAAGAIYNNGGNGGDCSPTIANCTFYANAAVGSGGTGGAIYNNGNNGGNSSPLITNCIIHGNTGPFGSHVLRNIYGTPTIQYSIVDVDDCDELNSGEGSNVSCGAGMLFTPNDPLFVDASTGDLKLQETSPAIDSGNDSDNTEAEDLSCDQRKINTIDMGAYEAPDAGLPVELAEFSAYLDQDKVTLFWITLSEEDNAYFTIERSNNGRDFEAITTIQGAGNATEARVYKEFDFHPIAGANYYRIKNTSFYGQEEYSPIRIVEVSPKRINIYPNPVESQITVSFSDFNEDEAVFSIYNIYGKQLYSGTTRVENEVSFLALPEIGNFVPGTYILEIHTPKNGTYSHRFQKIRD